MRTFHSSSSEHVPESILDWHYFVIFIGRDHNTKSSARENYRFHLWIERGNNFIHRFRSFFGNARQEGRTPLKA